MYVKQITLVIAPSYGNQVWIKFFIAAQRLFEILSINDFATQRQNERRTYGRTDRLKLISPAFSESNAYWLKNAIDNVHAIMYIHFHMKVNAVS